MGIIAVESMQVASALSMLACFAIIVVVMRLGLTRRLFLRLVFYIAISDFGSSMAMVIGGTRSGSAACYYQGIVNNYFTLASIFWTMVIGYEVHLVIWYHQVQADLTILGGVIWALPLILSITPLSTSTYGNDDGTPGWCFLNEKPGYSNDIDAMWYVLSFYLWVYIAIFYLLYVAILTAYKLYYLQRGMATDTHIVVEKIIYYPIIVIVCWVVSSVVDIGVIFGYDIAVAPNDPVSIIFTYVLPNLQGFFSGMVFFTSNLHILEEFYQEVCKEGLFVIDRCCWCFISDSAPPTSGTPNGSLSQRGDSDATPTREREDSLASFASFLRQTRTRREGGLITSANASFSSATDLNLLEHAHIKTTRTISAGSISNRDADSNAQRVTEPTANTGRTLSTGLASFFGGGVLFRSQSTADTTPADSNYRPPAATTTHEEISSKRPFGPISISKKSSPTKPKDFFAKEATSKHSTRTVGSALSKSSSAKRKSEKRASIESNYNATIRSSDIEMNPRPPSSSSMSYSQRRTIDYGGWDDGTEEGDDDSFYTHSEDGVSQGSQDDGDDNSSHGSSQNSSTRGSTVGRDSSTGLNKERRGSNKRQSLSKGRPSVLLHVIEEEGDRDSQASQIHAGDLGVDTTVSPMFSNNV